MKASLETLCARFIENRDAVRAAFRLESDYLYPVCANIFLSADVTVEKEKLEACQKMVKATTGPFSSFRGNIKLPLLCMLAASADPEDRWARTQRAYAQLKEGFSGSEYLALVALLLTGADDEADMGDLAQRGRSLYRRMKKEHPFLTGQEDSVLALLLAQSPRNEDELIEDMEACYRLLDERFPKGDALQSTSHVLALSAAAPEAKAGRMIALFDAITAAGGKYGKDRQLPVLAALSFQPGSVEELVEDLLDLDGLLAQQKGYRGVFGLDKRTRLMHGAMLLSTQGAMDAGGKLAGMAAQQQSELVNAVAQQTTIALIAAQQALMCALIASSAASSAASHASH